MQIITLPLDQWVGHKPEYKYDERTTPIRYIIVHSTGGTDSRGWLARWNRKDPKSAQNNVSIHYLIQRDGVVYKIIDNTKRAWHVGVSLMPEGETDGNSTSIGIELEHLNEANYTELQMQSAAELIYGLMTLYSITPQHIVSHASVARPIGRKVDPVNFDWGDLWTRITKLSDTPVEQPPYTAYSFMISTPQIDAQSLTAYLLAHHTYKQYTPAQVTEIYAYYKKYGLETGVNWLFAIAQMIHETGWIESWWSGEPRRNPAGIGVTGQKSTTNPNDPIHWVRVGDVWLKGQSFPNWDIAVQQHIARLLLYALKDNEMTPQQLAFSKLCLDHDRLDRIRGVAKQFIGLNGVWAVPGRTYSQQIVALMNSFLSSSQ